MRYALAHAFSRRPRWPFASLGSAAAALAFLALAQPAPAEEQNQSQQNLTQKDIEIGSGLVCDTQEQVQRYVQLFKGNAVEAAQQVNKEVGQDEACAFG